MIQTLGHHHPTPTQTRKTRSAKAQAEEATSLATLPSPSTGKSHSKPQNTDVMGESFVYVIRARLSPADKSTLLSLLESKCDFVPSETFLLKDAPTKIFDEAPEIRQPDTSWYHPVMDNFGTGEIQTSSEAALVLTAEQEQALFLQYNYCRYRVHQAKKAIGRKPVTATLAKEMLHWHVRAEAYRDQITRTNLALVLAMAKRMRMSEVNFSDLISEGNMALLRAVDKFDAARGFKFSTYACRAILKAFSRAGVKLSKYRAMFPMDFDPKYERSDYLEIQRKTHEEDCVEELRDIIGNNTADLTDIEREVITHRFAIDPFKSQQANPNANVAIDTNGKPMTLEQVGRIIGVTKERVRQIQNKALEKLRQSLEDGFLS